MLVVMASPITAEQLAALPPEFQAILCPVTDHYERQIAELIARLKRTPGNSSRPPPRVHPTRSLRPGSRSRAVAAAASLGMRSTSVR
jgi:hypothetical protein